MRLREFAKLQGLNKQQAKILRTLADKMVKSKIILAPGQLYKALAAGNAYLTVQEAASLVDLSAYTIRRLGKAEKFIIDGSKKIHRVEINSLLKYIRTRSDTP